MSISSIASAIVSANSWKWALSASALSLTAGTAIGWHERSLREPAILEAQKNADIAECNNDKAITKEANDALQKDRDIIARKLASARLQHPMRCVSVSNGAQLPPGGSEHARQDGISPDWLREYAAECEEYRGEIGVCIKFINQISGNH